MTQKDLLLVEDEVKKISLYLWLSYKFPELFPDYDKAVILRNSFNSFIEKSLKLNLKLNEPERNRTYNKPKTYSKPYQKRRRRD